MNINISENESTNNFQTKIKNNDSPRFTIKKFKKEILRIINWFILMKKKSIGSIYI